MNHISFAYHIESRYDYTTDPEIGKDSEGCEAADENILDERSEITIRFDYPLRNPCNRSFERVGGFSRRAFAEAVADGYAAIYEEEEQSRTVSPEPHGLLMNRSETDGVHGIVCHDLCDLVLEGAYQDGEGIWQLIVGS